jgi:hypothetical protein
MNHLNNGLKVQLYIWNTNEIKWKVQKVKQKILNKKSTNLCCQVQRELLQPTNAVNSFSHHPHIDLRLKKHVFVLSLFSQIHILAKQEIAENISSHAFPSLLWFLLMKYSHATCSEPMIIIPTNIYIKVAYTYRINVYYVSYHGELAEKNLWVCCILFLWTFSNACHALGLVS